MDLVQQINKALASSHIQPNLEYHHDQNGSHRLSTCSDWLVKNLPAMQVTWARSLDREDPLEKGMAHHSSILAWRIPWTEEPGGLQLMGSQKSHPHTLLTVIIFLVVV